MHNNKNIAPLAIITASLLWLACTFYVQTGPTPISTFKGPKPGIKNKIPLRDRIDKAVEQEFELTKDPATNTVPRERLLQALAYAKERVQGGDMKVMNDKASPRVTIIKHPDVRRSLMVQKSYSEGMRALVLYTASIQDEIELAIQAGDKERAEDMEKLNDLLLPVVKGYGSEKSWTLLGTESLQTFGGAGFTRDWPIEQYVRDAKIDTLYEGTTAIQGLDFFFRKIVKDGGRAIGLLGKEIATFAKAGGSNAAEKTALLKALDDLNAIIAVLVGHAMESQTDPVKIYKTGLNTSRCLMAVGDIITSWLLLRQADIAVEKLPTATGKDKDFYTGKIAAAQFFVKNYLPHITADRKIVEATDGSIMELPESAF